MVLGDAGDDDDWMESSKEEMDGEQAEQSKSNGEPPQDLNSNVDIEEY